MLVLGCPCGLTFTWWGCYGLCPKHKPTELAHSFYPVLVSVSVSMPLLTVFHSINSPHRSIARARLSPRAHLLVVGIYELAHSFYSVLVSVSGFMALSTVFHPISSPDNSPLSPSVLLVLLCLIGPFIYIPLYESLPQP